MKFAQDIIITPVITENSMDLARNQKKYTFKAAKDANKIEIKNAVDYVVKYNRQCKEKHKPSSIIKMSANGQFTIIRE